MIPLAVVSSALALATELLKAFNGLNEETKNRLVNDILNDKAKRDAAWGAFTEWWKGIFSKVQL